MTARRKVCAVAWAVFAALLATPVQALRCQAQAPRGPLFLESGSMVAISRVVSELDRRGSQLRLEVLPNGSVVPAWQLVEAVNKGTLDCAVVSTDLLAASAPSFRVYQKPYAFESLADVLALQFGETSEEFKNELSGVGVEFGGLIGGEFTYVASTRAYTSPSSFKGAKIAADPDRRFAKDDLSLWGAVVTPLNSSDTAHALTMGSHDSTLAPYSQLLRAGAAGAVNVLPLKQSFIGYVLIFSGSTIAALSPQERRTLELAILSAQDEALRPQVPDDLVRPPGNTRFTALSAESRQQFLRDASLWESVAPASSARVARSLPPPSLAGQSARLTQAGANLEALPASRFERAEDRVRIGELVADLKRATRDLEGKSDILGGKSSLQARVNVEQVTGKIGAFTAGDVNKKLTKSDFLAIENDVRSSLRIAQNSSGTLPQDGVSQVTVEFKGAVPADGVQVYVVPAFFMDNQSTTAQIRNALTRFSMRRDNPPKQIYQFGQLRMWIGAPFRWNEMAKLIQGNNLADKFHVLDLRDPIRHREVIETFDIPRELVKP